MKIPARCNRRVCQARRNLTKRPELYKTPPKCHILGCRGLMYVGTYRLRRGQKDNAPVCRDTLCPYVHPTFKRGRPMHRINTRGCSQYPRYVTERNVAPRSKHSPISADTWVPF